MAGRYLLRVFQACHRVRHARRGWWQRLAADAQDGFGKSPNRPAKARRLVRKPARGQVVELLEQLEPFHDFERRFRVVALARAAELMRAKQPEQRALNSRLELEPLL